MLDTERRLRDLIKVGRGYKRIDEKYIDDYKSFVRHYTGNLTEIVQEKRLPLIGLGHLECEKILEVINPELTKEVEWFKDVSAVLKEWHNNIVTAMNDLGLKYYTGE